MTTNAVEVVGVLLSQMRLVHGSVDELIEKMSKFKLAIGAGVAAIAGSAALSGMWEIVRAARELNLELDRTRTLGGDIGASVDSARRTAFNTSFAVPTTTAAENVRVQRELATQLQHADAAAEILPAAQRIAYVVSNYTGENVDQIVRNLARVADLRAQIYTRGPDGQEHVDQALLVNELNAAARGLILGGGFVRSNDMLMMARQAGIPAKLESPEAFYGAMVEMMISQGAERAGTATTSMYQQLVGGQMARRTAEEMQRVGMLHEGDWSSDAGHIVVQPAARERLQNQVGSDPIAYITGPLNDLMTRLGMDRDAKLNEVFALFGRQTTQRLVAEALSAEPQFARARAMFGTIPDPSQTYNMLQQQDLTANMRSLQAAWETFMQALGEQGIPVAITVLQNLTGALQAMTRWAVDHPDATRNIEMVAAALATLAAVGGTLVLTALGLRLVAGALSFMSAITGLSALGSGLMTLSGGLTALVGASSGLVLLASRLSLLAGAITAVYGILRLGSDHETPENRQRLENLDRSRRQVPPSMMEPQDGYGVDGLPLPRKESYNAPNGPSGDVVHVTNISLDGELISRTVSRHLATSGSGQTAGPTGYDLRSSWTDGLQGASI